ncbi:MAG TPA: restriction endonuclease subunit S [Anaerohalosphaeraceae bacterium]|nr:restriction endonuclease subunit S [Anaerohalosphaeraceae bacterium]
MTDWKETTWGTLATLEYGKSLRNYENAKGMYRVYGTNGPIGWHNEPLCTFPSIIIGRKGAYRGVHFSPEPFFVIDTAFYLKPKTEFDIKWAYYQLLTQDINGMDSGSAIPSTSREEFYNLKVILPPLSEQKAIAAVLSSFDDKIELLRRQNKTLESIAQAIFREWFVKFRVNGEQLKVNPQTGLPEGWRWGKLGEVLLEIQTGKRPKGGVGFLKSGIPSIGAENILGLGIYDFSKEKYISEDFYESMEQGKLQSRDVLLYKDGAELGRKSFFAYGFPHEKCAINEHVFILRAKEETVSQEYLFLWLDLPEITGAIRNLNSNSAQPGINREQVKTLDILLPDRLKMVVFNQTIKPVFEKIFKNCKQIQTLSKLRDTLLPKLMKGEIRVKSEQ